MPVFRNPIRIQALLMNRTKNASTPSTCFILQK